jgi:D-alanine-D-alanine ligase-like ATP-grasp enzyme
MKGRELTVGIVGDEALPVGEIIPKHEIFDYECKYQPGLAEEIFPGRPPERAAEAAPALALQAHRRCGCVTSRASTSSSIEGRPVVPGGERGARA